jgi:sphingomyelin phosphodiesterase 2
LAPGSGSASRVTSAPFIPALIRVSDSALFGDFIAGTGLDDAFEGSCPGTFRAEYLPAGKMPHCIDFILTAGEIKAQDAEVLFTGRQVLRSGTGYVSDHLGLLARLNCLGA